MAVKEERPDSQKSLHGKRKCDVKLIAETMFGDSCIQAINMDVPKANFEIVIWTEKIDREICQDKDVAKERLEQKLKMCTVTFIKKDK